MIVNNLHLDPNLSSDDVHDVLRSISRATPCDQQVLSFVVGDFNCHIKEEGKLNTNNKNVTYQTSRFSHIFDHPKCVGGDYYTHGSTTQWRHYLVKD